MTVFGIFWIIYLFYCLSKKGMYHMFFALSLSMVLQCDNVFQFGSIGIGPQIITSIFFIAYYLFKNQFKFPIQKENGLQLIGLLLLLLPIFISRNPPKNGAKNWCWRSNTVILYNMFNGCCWCCKVSYI